MINLKNIKIAHIILVTFQIITPNISLASDSISDTESYYDDGNNDLEQETTLPKKAQHCCLWEDCRDERMNFASAKELYEHVIDEHATRSDDNYYKCYWQGCHFEIEGDRHRHRHFISHCDSVHIKYGAIRCEECNTKLFYTENRSSHQKRCPGKPPKRTTLAKEGFHCRWKNCRDEDAKKINDGQHLYEHIQEKHITQKHGKMKACLWQGCKFRPNISEHRQPAVYREAILRHCAKEHADYRPFKCPIQGCQQAFYNNSNLGDHKRRCSKTKNSEEPATSSISSSHGDDDIEEIPEESELSVPDQTDEDDDNPPVRRSKRIQKRKAQADAQEVHPRATKRACSNKTLKIPEDPPSTVPVAAILVFDSEDNVLDQENDSTLTQCSDAPVPLDLPLEDAVPATVSLNHPYDGDAIDIPAQHFYNQPTPDEPLARFSSTSETSSVIPPAPEPPPVLPPPTLPPTAFISMNVSGLPMVPAPMPRPILGFSNAPPPPIYLYPANQTVIAPKKIYTCRWMQGCGIQFTSKDLFLRHVQQAHLLMCGFSNCGEGPYLNEEALLLHLARKHGCH